MTTLCPTTYEIASKMDNFSAWIRIQLLAFDHSGDSLDDAIRQRNFWKAKYDEEVAKNESS
jgi:hypothetical protein